MATATAVPNMAKRRKTGPNAEVIPKTGRPRGGQDTTTVRVWSEAAELLDRVHALSSGTKVDLASEVLVSGLRQLLPKLADELRKKADQLEEMN